MNISDANRLDDIIKRRFEGNQSLKEIAQDYSLSKQRIAQLINTWAKYHRISFLPFGKNIKTQQMACPICGGAFYLATSWKRKYCSRKCSNEGQRKQVAFNCEQCGKGSSTKLSKYIKNPHHFCSKVCRSRFRGLNYGFGVHPENCGRHKKLGAS
jgi:endogenous inhibitor of DNA gyrase (YacG/DUF329 family)